MIPNDLRNKRILFSPLNWGLGHVSRSIQLINELVENDNLVFIACSEPQKNIYLSYFNEEQIEYINHSEYPFHFNGKGNFFIDSLFQFKQLSQRLKQEYSETEQYVQQFQIDVVISDHRYGFYSKSVSSIFVTHQLNLPLPFYGKLLQYIHEKLIKKFTVVWVLDESNHRFSGKLSVNKQSFKVEYIGLKSRFSFYPDDIEKIYEKVVVVSGPEPYSRIFFNEQLDRFKNDSTVLIITPKRFIYDEIGVQCKIVVATNWLEVDQLIRASKMIISRSGYSTIMDVHYLQIPFEFHPTQGQAEQIYLAELHSEKNQIK